MQIAQIDWMDFVVVETIDFKEEERQMMNNYIPQNQFQPPLLNVPYNNVNDMNKTNIHMNMNNYYKTQKENHKVNNEIPEISEINVEDQEIVEDNTNDVKYITIMLKYRL